MPHRVELFVNVLITVGAYFSSCIAAVLALIPDVTAHITEDIIEITIMGDDKMRLICIIGALGGGVLSAAIFTPPKTNGTAFAIKVGTSSLAGILFTPGIIHYWQLKVNIDTLLTISALVAMTAVIAIRVAMPLWEKWVVKKISPPAE